VSTVKKSTAMRLVIAFSVMGLYVLRDSAPKVPLPHRHDPIQTFFLD
jgi:hypothetical protein